MRRSKQASPRRGKHQLVDGSLAGEVERRRPAGDAAVLDLEVFTASEAVVAGADEQHEVAFAAPACLDPPAAILEQADHPDHPRAQDGRLAGGPAVKRDTPTPDRVL